LSLKLRYHSQLELFVHLVAFLTNAKRDDVATRFKSFSHRWSYPLVPANPLCEFVRTKEWVLLLADDLLRGLINGVIAIVNDV